MGFLSRATLRCLALLVVVFVVPSPAAAARSQERIPGQYIVIYEGSVDDVGVATQRREAAQGFRARNRYARAFKGFSARLSDRQVQRLRADPAVADTAGASTAREASAARVAVLDTGIDIDHPDLRVTSGTNCITPGASPDDDDGHGTHVAGTIAAANEGAGVVGVAPGTPLAAVKVLDGDGSGSYSSIICGIDRALANDIDVVNMSLGARAARWARVPRPTTRCIARSVARRRAA